MLACWQQDGDSSPAMPQYSNFRAGTGRVEQPWPRCPLYRVVPATVGVAPPIPATVRVRGGRASDRITIPAALLGSGSTGGDGEEFEAAGAVGKRFNSGRVGPRTDQCRRVRRNRKLRLRALMAVARGRGVLLLRSAVGAARLRAAPFIVRCSELGCQLGRSTSFSSQREPAYGGATVLGLRAASETNASDRANRFRAPGARVGSGSVAAPLRRGGV